MNPTPTISEAARRAAEQEIDEFLYRRRITQPRRPFEAGHYVQQALASAHPTPKEGSTPQTDAVAKAIGSLACQWRGGSIDAVQFEQAAQAEMNKLGQLELRLSEAKRLVDAQGQLLLRDVDDMKLLHNELHERKETINRISSHLKTANELLDLVQPSIGDDWAKEAVRTHLNQQSK